MKSVSVISMLTLVLLAGCTAAPPAPYGGVDYGTAPQLRLNMAEVLIDNSYQPAGGTVDEVMSPRPAAILHKAMELHYRPTRPQAPNVANLRLSITDASVTEQALPKTQGMLASDQPAFRYSGRLAVEGVAENAGRHAGTVRAEASRSLDVGSATPAERQRLVQGMVRQMIDDLIPALDEQIKSGLGVFVLSGQDIVVMPQPSGRWDTVRNWK